MQTVKDFRDAMEGKSFMANYHTMIVPLRPAEMPTDDQLAGLAVEAWHDVPRLAERIKEAQAQIDEIDGQRVLIVWFKRWPSDPVETDDAA